jgi:hypothetical protein
MSILDEIDSLVAAGSLYRLRPEIPARELRRMYLSTEINSMLFGPLEKSEEVRWGRALADLLVFVEGEIINVPSDSRKGRSAYMSQLKPPHDEVWDIRCRDPKPGIRILVRFAQKDIFIALTWELRMPLGNFSSSEWRDAKLKCKTQWNHLLPAYKPFSGTYPYAYISGANVD